MSIKVVELFAGVGGFRVGLEGYPKSPKSDYEVVWSNQYEPSTKVQHASKVYESRWPGSNHSNQDISNVPSSEIPDHDLLVGGFPCQDYSVASTLKNSGGLIGKKGVLWWQIYRLLEDKGKKAPDYLLLENVDRLLISPASQRGRDFAVMLSSLNQLGYAAEWRVINAADYGMPQRRRRIFIFGYKKGTVGYKRIIKLKSPSDLILERGVFAETLPVSSDKNLRSGKLDSDLVKLSESFNSEGKKNPFENSGYIIGGTFYTMRTESNYDGPRINLKDILVPAKKVNPTFYLNEEDLPKWQYMKGAKNEERYNKAGKFHYRYAEGGMHFPDPLDRPSRTVITGEGGRSPSRIKHVVSQKGKLRRLTPIELERLNMFPDDHTKLDGISDSKRAFFMGNALVVGVVVRIAKTLAKSIE